MHRQAWVGGSERRSAEGRGGRGLGVRKRAEGNDLGRGRRWGRGGEKQALRGAAGTAESGRGPAAGGGSALGRPRGAGPITVPGSGRRPGEVRLGGGAGRPVRAPSLDSTDLLHIGFSPPPTGGGSRAEAMTSSQPPEVVECKKLPRCFLRCSTSGRREAHSQGSGPRQLVYMCARIWEGEKAEND